MISVMIGSSCVAHSNEPRGLGYFVVLKNF